ncbi:MAG: PaaI family thioesterase [Oscillospiraceae bacterium]|nr:PaaI family thioesterase [Oscillospiraceae bacterium]MBO7423343.1 PaaI family thioesterase [Oscillospiraceae bacterium]MBO7727470.1 PaaI family thioesterase [Oscillospiraceae bacterium]MBP5169158.1 PaaI family thioesterase [Oscillospiraceae bacterium]
MDNYRPRTSEDAISVAKQIIWEKFGISFSTVENGTACGELILNPRYLNFYGVPFGGVLFNLADNTAGMAFLSAGGNGVTVSGNVNYLRGADPDVRKLVCHAIVKKTGRRLFFIDAEVSDEFGNVLSEYNFIFTNIAEEA